MITTLDFTLGPTNDRIKLNFKINYITTRVGVLVSGGIDSAILYYLMLLYNLKNNNRHNITHYHIFHNNIFANSAEQIIRHINNQFNIPFNGLNFIGDGTLDDIYRIPQACREVITKQSVVYCGHIKVLPEHSINVNYDTNWKESHLVKYPFKDLNKSHIVDLVIQNNCTKLFGLSHSCVNGKICNLCNRCNELNWAFKTLGKSAVDKC
jgi:7-cyano-7-deazaguanine synthase in queuosine biosynthesis